MVKSIWKMMEIIRRRVKLVNGKTFLFIFFLLSYLPIFGGIIKGTVKDRLTKEPLIGSSIQIKGTTIGAISDYDGNFEIPSVEEGIYTLEIKYVSYKSMLLSDIKVSGEKPVFLSIEMEPETQTLENVTVVAQAKKSTEAAMLTSTKNSLLVRSGVSAQQISKTQDKDASEVIRRVPGISIIEDKFVMVRGLSQRYNNVWINNSAVPSTEADSRAFSFDIIPSSQLDNVVIVKSPAPEYPADFTGGFILVNTKDMPSENGLNIAIGGSINDRTHFNGFLYNKGSKTDFLGFDNGLRSLSSGMKGALRTFEGSKNEIDLKRNGFNNDWTIRKMKPIGDLKLNVAYHHKWDTNDGRRYAVLAAFNYGNAYHTYTNMENSLFGSYDIVNDRPVYLRKSIDNQYSHDIRLGAMLNITFQPRRSNHRYELKNIFNQLGKNRYTTRSGFTVNDKEYNTEYYYSSRTVYNGQFTGKHTLENNAFDWSAGYAYANRYLPDRRLIETNDRTNEQMGLYRISREFTHLDEHTFSGNINYKGDFVFGSFTPSLKTGVYTEYRTREYSTRRFDYAWKPVNTLPVGFEFTENIPENLLVEDNYASDKLYLLEQINKLNDYSGNNTQAAGYAAFTLPFGKLDIYAGVRYEYNRTEVIQNSRKYEVSRYGTVYEYNDFFPSLNAVYHLTEKQQLRLAYGKSVNRPEFRELSSSVFYDFDLASDVMGNPALKPAYIQNIDFRYEFYPAPGEQVTVALFYKNFKHPIEWTYTVSGGTDLVYSYMNAEGADNYGIEVDVRKKLDFIGLCDFSLNFNAALIKSQVRFKENSQENDRAMQGQSPYLINTGLYYQNQKVKLNAALLYNRIGKRIVGVGRNLGSVGGENTKNLPNSYEMPRNTVDFSIGKQFGHWEIKATVRDLLAERVIFRQMENVITKSEVKEIEEITKSYRPGRNFGITVNYNF